MVATRTDGNRDGSAKARRRSWGERAVRAPRRVLILAGMLCLVCGAMASGLGERLSAGGFAASGTLSARAEERAVRLGAGSPDLVLVLRPDARLAVDSPSVRAAGRRATEQLAAERGVRRARSYWTDGDRSLRSSDGRFALLRADLRGDETEAARTAQRLVPRYTARSGPFTVRATGPAWTLAQSTERAHRDLVRAELIAAPLTFAILAVAFRSLAAALLPVLVGGVATVGTLAVLRVLTAVTDVSVFAVNLVGALGFGLAVDYALFLVARYREERARGLAPPAAAEASVRTAGRTVAVSAATVTAALAALLVFPFSFLRSMAYAGMAVVVLAALAAVLVLPAVLAQWGPRMESLDPLGRLRWAPASTVGGDSPLWRAVARGVTRRPVWWGAGCLGLLVLLVLPFGQARLGLADERILPARTGSPATADLIRREWGTPAAGSLTVVLPRAAPAADRAALDAYGRRLSALAGVRGAVTATGRYEGGGRVGGAPPAAVGGRGRGTVATLTMTSDPQSERAARLVREVRALPAPGPAHLAGWAAQVVDARAVLSGRLPLAAGLIAAGTAVVVFLFTRSVLIPLKVLAVAALSLGAALGGTVQVFQNGRLRWLLGDFTPAGTLDMTIPLLLFSVAFGLSVDYELFLLSRIQEHYRATGDNTAAVVHGIARTGRLFTAAALAVAVAMGALASSDVLLLKELGFGLALAVIVDATVVRGVLVPAVMRLAGRANWWGPTARTPRSGGPATPGAPAGGTPTAPPDAVQDLPAAGRTG
ncbi:MMPL family transporter [Streptomyces sp. NPDC020742]|uniref:MMPL family transporter n=1 Tax=Streptomyces sp. NPDC020742 TaxID=3154897 RepID=UPI0033F02BE1